MSFIWSFKSPPELAAFTLSERRTIWRKCYWESFSKWQVWVAFIANCFCFVLGEEFFGEIGKLIGMVLGLGVFIFVTVNIAHTMLPEVLQRFQKRIDG